MIELGSTAAVERRLAEAAAACRAAGRAVSADADDRARVAAAASATWAGPHRRTFDEALAAHQHRAARLEDEARRVAARVEELVWRRG